MLSVNITLGSHGVVLQVAMELGVVHEKYGWHMQRRALQERVDVSNTIIALRLCHCAVESFLQIHQSQQSPEQRSA